MRRVSMRERGFSLIELGIVVAVIAILATVVLVGRGFLQSSRVSKMVEVLDTIAKGSAVYAGTNGGKLPEAAGVDYMPQLVARTLITAGIGTSVPDFTLAAVNAQGPAAPSYGEHFIIPVTCGGSNPNQACQDLCYAKRRDHAIIGIAAAAPGVMAPAAVTGFNCATLAGTVAFRYRL